MMRILSKIFSVNYYSTILARIIPEDISEPGQEAGCPKWYPDWSALAELQPRIKLDPNKILTPLLTYGYLNLLSLSFTINLAQITNNEVFARQCFSQSSSIEQSCRLAFLSIQQTRMRRASHMLILLLPGIDSTFLRWRQ